MKTSVIALLVALVVCPPIAIGQDTHALSLRRKKLHAVPAEVWATHGLQTLDLSFNPLTELPDSIARLSLTHLSLVKTYITDFPASVAGSTLAQTLQYLDMRSIRMTEEQQKAIRTLFPNAVIKWDFPCDCGAD